MNEINLQISCSFCASLSHSLSSSFFHSLSSCLIPRFLLPLGLRVLFSPIPYCLIYHAPGIDGSVRALIEYTAPLICVHFSPRFLFLSFFSSLTYALSFSFTYLNGNHDSHFYQLSLPLF